MTRHDRWFSFFFFFNDTATTEIYTLSLHDALPILGVRCVVERNQRLADAEHRGAVAADFHLIVRSEEHTSELQSPCNLVCRLLLEKKKKNKYIATLCNVNGTTPSFMSQ